MKKLTAQQRDELIQIIRTRFMANMHRHTDVTWDYLLQRIVDEESVLWSLNEMETTGGEPDLVVLGKQLALIDCAKESPKERRSLCYDQKALESRKENKPKGSATELADAIGITMLSEAQYRQLQEIESFDLKTSSWVLTSPGIRKLGGAVFCDRRYDTVFLYHNGAESYYASRGFRGILYLP